MFSIDALAKHSSILFLQQSFCNLRLVKASRWRWGFWSWVKTRAHTTLPISDQSTAPFLLEPRL